MRLGILLGFCSLGLLAVARPAELSDAKLAQMVSRSDLIVVAQTKTICGGCRGEGPYPDGIHPTPEYREFVFPLSTKRVLKGTNVLSSPWWVSYTALVYGPKDPAPTARGHFSFKFNPQEKEQPLEGAPKPEMPYVFFFQNRKLREPGSYEAAGAKEIIYSNFDFDSGMLPASQDLIHRIEALVPKR